MGGVGGRDEAVEHFQIVLFQANDLNIVYLDSCTTSSTFVGDDTLTDVKGVKG